MKILVTGGNGQLGAALKAVLIDEETLFTDTGNMDITNPEQVESVFANFKPDFLVHGAAYTNVDGAEENIEIARKVNVEGTRYLAEVCKKHNVKMIYISTDYVFDGKKSSEYTEEDTTNPQSVYGKTKLEGEVATKIAPIWWILRTQWLYGEGKNFVRTMLALSEKMDEINVVSDQCGHPTAAIDLAKAIADVMEKEPASGIYHVANDGPVISWADFTKKIFEIAGKNTRVTPISTQEYLADKVGKKIASRPAYSPLSVAKAKAAGIHIANWEEALKNYLLQK